MEDRHFEGIDGWHFRFPGRSLRIKTSHQSRTTSVPATSILKMRLDEGKQSMYESDLAQALGGGATPNPQIAQDQRETAVSWPMGLDHLTYVVFFTEDLLVPKDFSTKATSKKLRSVDFNSIPFWRSARSMTESLLDVLANLAVRMWSSSQCLKNSLGFRVISPFGLGF